MAAFFMTVCLTIVWMVIFTVKLESINTVAARHFIYSSHNGTVPVQVSISSNRMMSYDVTLQVLIFKKYAVASFLAS